MKGFAFAWILPLLLVLLAIDGECAGLLEDRQYENTTSVPACVTTCEARFPDYNKTCSSHRYFYNAPIARCIQTTCPTLSELLDWQRSACPNLSVRHQGVLQVSLSFVLFGIATLSVAGRLLSRSKRLMDGPGYWWDDFPVLILWSLAAVEMAVCLPFLHKHGAGKDVIADGVTLAHLQGVGQWIYISEVNHLGYAYNRNAC